MSAHTPVNDMASPSHDDRIKRLLCLPRLLVAFFEAFLPEVFEFTDLSVIEYIDKEHPRGRKRPRRTGDLLVKTNWNDHEAAFLIHFESQNTPQQQIIERVTEYAMRDSIRYGLPVMPVVLLTYPRPEKPVSGRLSWKFGKLARIQVSCPVLHFRRMDARRHLSGKNVAGLALSSLMKLSPDDQVEAIVQTVAESLRQRLKQDEIEAALDFVQSYTVLGPDQLLQLEERVRKLAHKDKHLATMPKLINPFVEIGRLHGRTQGEQQMILRLLQRKFPAVAKRAEPLVRKLDEEGLLSFGEALLFMDTPAKCLAWLKERV